MQWLNYHHLLYFWTVAKEGSVTTACRKLHLAQPTISAQIRVLERSLGQKLFVKRGRNLVLTETGLVVFRYADEIFAMGHELLDALAGKPTSTALRFQVGIADVLPKLVTYRLLAPVFSLAQPVQTVCLEGDSAGLLAKLALGELDVVLSDMPIDPNVHVKAFNHVLGVSGASVLGRDELARRYRRRFPTSLDGAPFLLPTKDTMLRRTLDRFFEEHDIRPTIVAEFADSALLKVFGQSGAGLFVAPTVIEKDVQSQYRVRLVGRLPSVTEQYYAISIERRITHPAVVAITQSARSEIFGADRPVSSTPATSPSRARSIIPK